MRVVLCCEAIEQKQLLVALAAVTDGQLFGGTQAGALVQPEQDLALTWTAWKT